MNDLIEEIEAQRAIEEVEANAQGPLVLIDPGHGGDDKGSPGLDGLWEGKVTLDLARRLQRSLQSIAPRSSNPTDA